MPGFFDRHLFGDDFGFMSVADGSLTGLPPMAMAGGDAVQT
jgi:hypothetical protein